jgi:hypothetical protein
MQSTLRTKNDFAGEDRQQFTRKRVVRERERVSRLSQSCETKILVKGPAGPETKNDCAGEV